MVGAKKIKSFKNCTNNVIHHTKLKYHTRRLENSDRSSKIVSKYVSCAETWSESDVIRHSIHVIAWVALATPKCCGVHPHSWPCSGSCPSGLSCRTLCDAAELLDMLLRKIRYATKTRRLKYAIRLLEKRLQHPEILEQRDGVWFKLRKTLASQRPSSVSACIGPSVRARLLHKPWSAAKASGNKFFECVVNKDVKGKPVHRNALKSFKAADLLVFGEVGSVMVDGVAIVDGSAHKCCTDKSILHAMLYLGHSGEQQLDAYLNSGSSFDYLRFREIFDLRDQGISWTDLCREVQCPKPPLWMGFPSLGGNEVSERLELLLSRSHVKRHNLDLGSNPKDFWNDVRAKCPALPCDSKEVTKAGMKKGVKRKAEATSELDEKLRAKERIDLEIDGTTAEPLTLGSVRRHQKMKITCGDMLQGDERDMAVTAAVKMSLVSLETGDANEMIEAVVEVVGLLSAPREVAVDQERGVIMTDRAKAAVRTANQKRLRAALLRLLGSRGRDGLDTSDPGTSRLLAVPLERLRYLLQDRRLDLLACKDQWSALAAIAGVTGIDDVLQDLVAHAIWRKKKIVDSENVRHRSTAGGIYTPHKGIQGLPFVVERLGDRKLLACKRCDQRISSCWFFEPPMGKACVLVPRNGHIACKQVGQGSSIAHYVALDGSPTHLDHMAGLAMCLHGVDRRRMCPKCEQDGTGTCQRMQSDAKAYANTSIDSLLPGRRRV